MFRIAWKTVLSFENIHLAFATTGVHRLNLEKVLSQLKKKTPSPISSDSELKRKTPSSVRSMRGAGKALRFENINIAKGLDLIIRVCEKLAIRNDILEHENKSLRIALVDEKKRRKKGKL